MSYFLDISSLVREKSQKKLGEIQKKKFHPAISGTFFLTFIFILVEGLFCKMRYQPPLQMVSNLYSIAFRGIKHALKPIVSYALFFGYFIRR